MSWKRSGGEPRSSSTISAGYPPEAPELLAYPPDEAQDRMRDGIRKWVWSAFDDVGRGVRRATPHAMVASLGLCTIAPLLPVGGGDGFLELLPILGNLGAGYFGQTIRDIVETARDRSTTASVGRGGNDAFVVDSHAQAIETALLKELEDGASAPLLVGDISRLLKALGGVDVALAAADTTQSSAMREEVERMFQRLAHAYPDFVWVLDNIALDVRATRDLVEDMHKIITEDGHRSTVLRTDETPSPALLLPAGVDLGGPKAPLECPYVGMRSFREQESRWFCGRDDLTDEMIERVRESLQAPRFLAVIGPSGSGKSSLLAAGLMAAIERGQLGVENAHLWPSRLFTPGPRPIDTLALQLTRGTSVSAGELAERLRRDPTEIGLAVRQLVATHDAERLDPNGALSHEPGSNTRLILVIDQFEEVFTQCQDEDERRAFITAVTAISAISAETPTALEAEESVIDVTNADSRLHGHNGSQENDTRDRGTPAMVIVGMRADLYGRCVTHPRLRTLLQENQILVGPMSEDELRQAIEEPARRAGVQLEAGLVALLIEELDVHPDGSYEAGKLPYLGHALRATWDHRRDRTLTVEGYERSGRIDGAIERTAEEFYAELGTSAQGEKKQAMVKQVLFDLVATGENMGDTRRSASREKLCALAPDEPEIVEAVIEGLVQSRLATADAEGTVNVTHEALLTRWPRLGHWLAEDRDIRLFHAELRQAAEGWEQADRDPGRLFRGKRLHFTEQWLKHQAKEVSVTTTERAFVDAGLHAEHEERRMLRRSRGRHVATGALAVGIITLVLLTWLIQSDARDDAVKRSVQMAEEASALEPRDIESMRASMLLALGSWNTQQTAAGLGSVLSTQLNPYAGEIVTSNEAIPADERIDAIIQVAFSTDGSALAVAGTNGIVQLWDMNTRELMGPGDQGIIRLGANSFVTSLDFSPDGQMLAVGQLSSDTTADTARFDGVRLWDRASGSFHAELPSQTPTWTLAFSPDNSTLAVGTQTGVSLWSAETGSLLTSLDCDRAVTDLEFNRSGRTILAATGQDMHQWEVASGQAITAPSDDDAAMRLSRNDDGTLLVVDRKGVHVRTWNDDGSFADPHTLELSGAQNAAFGAGGNVIVSTQEGDLTLWNLASNETAALFKGRTTRQAYQQITFVPSSNILGVTTDYITNSSDIVGFVDTSRIFGLSAGLPYGSLSADGDTLAAGDGVHAWFWSLHDDNVVPRNIQYASPDAILQSAVSTEGRYAITTSAPGHSSPSALPYTTLNVTVWDLDTGSERFTTTVGMYRDLAISADGSVLAIVYSDVVLLRDLTNGEDTRLTVPPSATKRLPGDVEFNPDGSLVAVDAGDSGIGVWKVSDALASGYLPPAMTTIPLEGSTPPFIAFGPNNRLAVSTPNTLEVWDAIGSSAIQVARFDETMNGGELAFSPDGTKLATSTDLDHPVVQVWDLQKQRKQLELNGFERGIRGIRFSNDGSSLKTYDKRGLRTWQLDPELATANACRQLSRSGPPSDAELRAAWAYVPGIKPMSYSKICEHQQN